VNNSMPFHLNDREKALEPLMRALETGFDGAAKSRLHNAAAATCINIEQVSGASLPGITGYGARIHFDSGIHGEALLAIDERGLARIGRLFSGMEQAEDAPVEAEILKACMDFLAQGLEGSCKSFAQSCGLPIHCSPPIAVNPDGRRESLSALAGTFENAHSLTLRLKVPDHPDSLLFVLLQGEVLSSLNAQLPHYSARAAVPHGNAAPRDKRSQWNIDFILDVELEVAVAFGATQMPLRDILKLGVGSIIELEKGVNDPVDILVNEKPIARGEVVMVDGNYGVKVLEVESTAERIRSLG